MTASRREVEAALDDLDEAMRVHRRKGTPEAEEEVERLKALLSDLGATLIDPLGEPFDPSAPMIDLDVCTDIESLADNPDVVAAVDPDHRPQDGEVVGLMGLGCKLGVEIVREPLVYVFKGQEYGEV